MKVAIKRDDNGNYALFLDDQIVLSGDKQLIAREAAIELGRPVESVLAKLA